MRTYWYFKLYGKYLKLLVFFLFLESTSKLKHCFCTKSNLHQSFQIANFEPEISNRMQHQKRGTFGYKISRYNCSTAQSLVKSKEQLNLLQLQILEEMQTDQQMLYVLLKYSDPSLVIILKLDNYG